MRYVGIAAAVALLAQQGGAVAEANDIWSANSLMPGCRNFVSRKPGNDTQKKGICMGVVRATAELGPLLGACPPDGVIYGQVMTVVVTFIDKRPERMHEDFQI